MYSAHPAHVKNCFPNFTGGRKKIKKARSHIYLKGGSAPLKPPVYREQDRGQVTDGALRPLRAPLKHSLLLRVNPYSRRQAAVNQIISIPHGRKPVGQQTYLTYLRQHRTIAEASAVESPIRQETIGFPAHFFARAHNFKPPGRACQPEADSPMRT